jgi:SAM-dependent methyltransferase
VVALGLPAALLLQGVALPAWAWLVPLLLLVLLYPRRLWQDAPLFLTPARAFDDLPAQLPLPAGARLHDAGCGSGAALRAWRRAYPGLRLSGTEASRPLVIWARWRCPWAEVRHGDLWTDDWSTFDVVYLFQRPESMARSLGKARDQMRPGSWLVSLDFELPGARPHCCHPVGRHRLLVYAREDLN